MGGRPLDPPSTIRPLRFRCGRIVRRTGPFFGQGIRNSANSVQLAQMFFKSIIVRGIGVSDPPSGGRFAVVVNRQAMGNLGACSEFTSSTKGVAQT